MKSPTYGDVTIEEIRNIIESRVVNKYDNIQITVGTDSQSFVDTTKMVNVIAVRLGNNGGFFFYDVERLQFTPNLKQKINIETSKSVNLALCLHEELLKSDIDIIKKCPITIHVDIGTNGPTNRLINEIMGWVSAIGFNCEIKPNSFAASTIANRISK